NLRKNNLTGPIPDSLPVPQWFFPSASPPPPKPADGGLVPQLAVSSTSPPPPKPSGSVTPPVSVVAAAIAVALTSLLFV
ncbi:unnamed protein product, partial [Closterium sp. NIES-53]